MTEREPGMPWYSIMVDVTGGVIAAQTATVVGLSMGGGIAQEIAALHHDRVTSLVLMSTSPVSPTGVDLPGPIWLPLYVANPALYSGSNASTQSGSSFSGGGGFTGGGASGKY